MPQTEREKRILVHCASGRRFARLFAALSETASRAGDDVVVYDDLALRWLVRPSRDALLGELAQRYVNLIVLDLRCDAGASVVPPAAVQAAFAVLDALDAVGDVESRFAFDRILVLLPDATTPELDDIVLRLGARGVRHIMRASSVDDEPALARRLLDEVARILRSRKRGNTALCLSGGGITGIYFEIGALKCLDDCLGARGVNDFDMYFGISAGAVITGPIAVGYTVDEYMAAIAGIPGGRVPPQDLRLFRLGHVDTPSFARRAVLAARTTAAAIWSAITGRRAVDDDELLFDFADLVAAPFRADRYERELRTLLTAPGASNDFRRLTRRLFVGATDQDARTHVLFGDEDHADVPISRAIQASLSLNPAFAATRIDGRFYEDGAVTRTSNFGEAIRRGATLVVVLDPIVPHVAHQAGFASRRGVLYNIDQDIRTISYTRYETTRNVVLRNHPEVSAYTFVPANRLRRQMSVNPMDHRPWREIWRGGYLSMFNRLCALEHRLAGDLSAHGMTLDLERARETATRLERIERPALADFFPDRKIALRHHPLCLEVPAAPAPPTTLVAPAA